MLKMNRKTIINAAIIIAILVVSIMPIASAGVFSLGDNKVQLKEWYDIFGWFAKADVELISNTDQCFIDCEAVVKITPRNEMNIDKKSLKFEFSSDIRDYKYYIQIDEPYEKTTPQYDCITDEKEEKRCTEGKPLIEKGINKVWKEFDSENLLPNKDYFIRIVSSKPINKNIDWVLNFDNDRINQWAWWNSSWLYKEPLNLSVATGTTGVNYVLELNVSYNAHMNADFSDLRFTNSTENGQLNYWIEKKVNNGWAVVWLNVNEDITTTNKTNYLYYGNALATDAGNGTTTFGQGRFEGCDDNVTHFNNRWTKSAVDITAYLSGGICTINNTGGDEWFYNNSNTLTLPAELKLFGRYNSSGTTKQVYVFLTNQSDMAYNWEKSISLRGFSKSMFGLAYRAGTGGDVTSFTNTTFSVWDNYTMWMPSSSSTLAIRGFDEGSANITNATNTVWTSGGLPAIEVTGTPTASLEFDWLFTRQYKLGEPIYYFGLEQANPSTITTTLNSPVDYFNSSSQTIVLNCSGAVSTYALMNISLFGNWSGSWTLNETKILTGTDNSTTFTKIISDGYYDWNCMANDSNGGGNTTSANKTFTIDSSSPIITLPVYANATFENSTSNTLTLNISILDSGTAVQNPCWIDVNGTNQTIAYAGGWCNGTVKLTGMTGGNKTINAYGNNSAGGMSLNNSFVVYMDSNAPTVILNGPGNLSWLDAVSNFNFTAYDDGALPMNCSLYLNGRLNNTNDSTLNNTLTNFAVAGLLPEQYNWTVNCSDGMYNSFAPSNNTILEGQFIICNSTYDIPYLNITFKDETTDLPINGTAIPFDFSYQINSSSSFTQTKTYAYTNTTANNNYTFCFAPNLSISYTANLSYASSGYPTRNTQISGVLTNTSTNQTLYLLSTANGIWVTFQVMTSMNSPISGASIFIERNIAGTWYNVSSGLTDNAGSYAVWLNPNYLHRITVNKAGYATYTTTITPSQPLYTIVLGGGAQSANITTNTENVVYNILPPGTILDNRTIYTFVLNISSSYYVLQDYGFDMLNSTGAVLGGGSDNNPTGGFVNVSINTSDNKDVIMNYYWKANGSYVNFSKAWSMEYSYEGNYSLKYFFDDLKSFVGTAGLNQFSLTLIAFMLIFLVVGLISFTSGIYSPVAIGGEIIAMTWLFYFAGFWTEGWICWVMSAFYGAYIFWEFMR